MLSQSNAMLCTRDSTGAFSPFPYTYLGFYLYVESSGRRENDVARLRSKLMSRVNSDEKCLRFLYHMYGRSIGSLTVRLEPVDGPKKVLFSKSGSQGRRWKSAEMSLKSLGPYQVPELRLRT